ncbi:hypothetical protein D3C85_1919670 [compost metagenome]
MYQVVKKLVDKDRRPLDLGKLTYDQNGSFFIYDQFQIGFDIFNDQVKVYFLNRL